MMTPTAIKKGQKTRTTSRSPRQKTVGERISGQYWRLARQRRRVSNIMVCFNEQPAMLPLQVEFSIERLCSVRRATQQTGRYLKTLHPEDTRRLRPYGCIVKLTELESRLSEVIIMLAMFGQVCQSVTLARVDLHLGLRSLLPGMLTTLDDTTSQLAALLSTERSASSHQEREAAQ